MNISIFTHKHPLEFYKKSGVHSMRDIDLSCVASFMKFKQIFFVSEEQLATYLYGHAGSTFPSWESKLSLRPGTR